MKNPIIGITLDYEKEGGYSKFPWYAIRENYLTSLHKFGAIPFPLFHEKLVGDAVINIIDGLVVTGGNFDINPSLYGKKNKGSRNIKNIRTDFEIDIINKLLKTSKPILGICGGEQLLNVASGGDLLQDINKSVKTNIEHEQINPRDEVSHIITIKKNTKLYEITRCDEMKINSAHHQSVNKVGKNLISCAISEDGIIEAIEHTKHPWCLGVQWHPEFLITETDAAIIESFIDYAR